MFFLLLTFRGSASSSERYTKIERSQKKIHFTSKIHLVKCQIIPPVFVIGPIKNNNNKKLKKTF